MNAKSFFHQLLASPAPGDVLKASLSYGGFADIPYLGTAAYIPAGPVPYHSGSVLDHTVRCMNWTAGDPLAVWMAMTHDCGKLTTPRDMWPHHYGHEERGKTLAAIWGDCLCLDQIYKDAGVMASALHMRAARYPAMRPGKRLKIIKEIWSMSCPDSFLRVVEADSRSRVGRILMAHHRALVESGNTDEDAQIRLLIHLAKKTFPSNNEETKRN